MLLLPILCSGPGPVTGMIMVTECANFESQKPGNH